MTPPVVILGGGFAGLSAAVDLVEAGRRVLLLERRSFLGGRAYSFRDKVTGDSIDNGQHLMMGCYHETLEFLRKIGSLDKIKFQANPRVDFLDETEGPATFQCPPWPAPLHLLGGLMRLETIGWRERLGALRIGLALKFMKGGRAGLADITVRQWLDSLGQSERIQRKFWDLMALATLNEIPQIASADMFAAVLDRAFLRTKQDSTMVISRVGLSELYTENARRFIEARGGEVRLNADAREIAFENGRARRIILRDGQSVELDALVSAVPYSALKRLLPPELLASSEYFQRWTSFEPAPIVSINLWYAAPVMDLEFAGLLDSGIEWVFNKNAIAGGPAAPQHLALVISGAHEAARKPKPELIALATREMERFFPAARTQAPVHAFVIREHEATLSHSVGTARLRPDHQSPIPNFLLAGDWTNTGLPATIEGAVQSGRACARLLLRC